MNAKEYNKYLTALQEELGIHIVSVRNNTSVEDCHKSLAEIGKYLNDKEYKKSQVLLKNNEKLKEEITDKTELIADLKEKLEYEKSENKAIESFYRGALHEKKCYIEILAAALILSNGYWIAKGIIGWL